MFAVRIHSHELVSIVGSGEKVFYFSVRLGHCRFCCLTVVQYQVLTWEELVVVCKLCWLCPKSGDFQYNLSRQGKISEEVLLNTRFPNHQKSAPQRCAYSEPD